MHPEARPRSSALSRSVLSRFRLTGLFLLLAVGVVAAGFYGVVHNRYVGVTMSRMLGPFSDALAERGWSDEDDGIWQRIAERHHVTIVVEPLGREAFAFDSDGRAVAPELAPRTLLEAVRVAPDEGRVTFYWTLFAEGGLHRPLLAAVLAMIGALVGAAFWYLQRQLMPLARLQRGVEAVARGEFATRLPTARDDEIGRVAQAFNTMARQVGEMIAARDRLLADVSHELRSPITRMKVALELLPPSSERDSLDRDLRETEQLISVLLERESLRARAETADLAAGGTVDLRDLVQTVVQQSRQQHVGPGLGLEIQLEDVDDAHSNLELTGDIELLRVLVRNLVDNAVKFSRPGSGPVRISLQRRRPDSARPEGRRQETDRLVLRVIDDGRGVPAGSEEELFEPFAKQDPARGHHLGYGLGLDLCRRIARFHGGDVQLVRRSPRGVEAVVDLPATQPHLGETESDIESA